MIEVTPPLAPGGAAPRPERTSTARALLPLVDLTRRRHLWRAPHLVLLCVPLLVLGTQEVLSSPGAREGTGRPGTFDLLGFTHYWGMSRKGKWVVKRKTAGDRFSRGLKRIRQWCRLNRHQPIAQQWQVLVQKLRGHYGYFGIIGNFRVLQRFHEEVVRTWRKWLGRRSQRGSMPWDRMRRLLERYPLPSPRIVKPYCPAQ